MKLLSFERMAKIEGGTCFYANQVLTLAVTLGNPVLLKFAQNLIARYCGGSDGDSYG
ncbi:hypothetical protein [Runella zeae]|uniref:hypothetical protein n=1 Tax=Runella zeae TaxID=94255 RepID=UPI0012F9F16B|nr:hypothetical protein [Runella zeae]